MIFNFNSVCVSNRFKQEVECSQRMTLETTAQSYRSQQRPPIRVNNQKKLFMSEMSVKISVIQVISQKMKRPTHR